MDKRLPETKFCVETLLPQGLCILGGSPKVGKSWLVLDLCIHIAKGEPMWGFPVTQGETLYLCLEDSERRIQERINTITDDVPPGLYGYTRDPEIKGHLLINPETAPVVKMIFSLCAEGKGPRVIANALRKKKIPKPTMYRFIRSRDRHGRHVRLE